MCDRRTFRRDGKESPAFKTQFSNTENKQTNRRTSYPQTTIAPPLPNAVYTQSTKSNNSFIHFSWSFEHHQSVSNAAPKGHTCVRKAFRHNFGDSGAVTSLKSGEFPFWGHWHSTPTKNINTGGSIWPPDTWERWYCSSFFGSSRLVGVPLRIGGVRNVNIDVSFPLPLSPASWSHCNVL